MNFGNELSMEQRQILTQRQMQSLQILACNNQELDDLLSNEYAENPMLEHTAPQRDDFFTSIDALYETSSSFPQGTPYGEEEEETRKNDIPCEPSDILQKELMMQLKRSCYTEEEWRLFPLLIDCLDDSGFFPWDTGEISLLARCPEHMVKKCLHSLKQLEPIGIFSKDLSECLLRQLEQQGCEDTVLLEMIRDYLPDILKGQLSNVSRALHLSTATVRKYLLQIGKLNPRPIMNAQKTQTEYIVPDIVVTRRGEEWQIALNDKWMGRYQLNQYYIHMMKKSADSELNAYFRNHLERARFLLRCVEQRKTTILNITKEIIARQQPYFLKQGGLTAMTMQQIAETLQIHPSTVSRAIRGKYLQFQYGSVRVKDLFTSSGIEPQTNNGSCLDAVHEQIRDLIASEDKSAPYSDHTLVAELEKRGIHISRRTIAKYRGEMGIPNSDQRRYFT
ncbi:MAG: RNA polymerase factor sigma-54 [Clostridium sp.]|uniref:RNA polymerase factor sigma-54 n=1 Tax=Clostridium sp. TaxID=1506 RepID=UPI002906897C|nr:RNA polymerase factor sigma-54 [Clostridium sp.]MDU7336818.1 RNA polymerase factor sigma-54 [Clostridium sp.]